MDHFLRVSVHRSSATLLLIALIGMNPSAGRSVNFDFESDSLAGTAAGFTAQVGRWEVVRDGANQVLAQRAENRISEFNVTLIEQSSYKNVDLSVRIKAVAGENEQGGGLIWRAKDKDNYYAARYNPHRSRIRPREPNVCLYKVEAGKLTQLDHANVAGDTEWHTLRITMEGTEIVGYLDGRKLLEADDSTFLDVGKIGLWSRSDAQSYFDDLMVSTFPSKDQE